MAPSPSVFLAAAAQRTKRLRLGTLVYILPLYNPMRLAEELCMLDHLSRGRLEIGLGRGSTPFELEMLGCNPAETREIYDEALEILLTALTTGKVTFEGRHFKLHDSLLNLRPYQPPYPPLWYPSSNPDTLGWIGQQGYHVLLSFNTPTLDEVRRRLSIYRENLPLAATNPKRVNPHVPHPFHGFVRKVYVAETDAEALRVAREALEAFKVNFSYLWELHDRHHHWANLSDFDDCLGRGVFFAGSPATIRARLGEFFTHSGANYFGPVFAWGNLTTEQIMRSMDLFTREVMPAFRQPAEARR